MQGAASAPLDKQGGKPERPERRVKITRLRARVAERLKGAQNTYAMLTTFNEIDMTNIMQLRKDFKVCCGPRTLPNLTYKQSPIRNSTHSAADIPDADHVGNVMLMPRVPSGCHVSTDVCAKSQDACSASVVLGPLCSLPCIRHHTIFYAEPSCAVLIVLLPSSAQEGFQEKHGVKLGFMSAFVKASSDALRLVPAVNAVIEGDELVYRDYTDISIAVATPKGLVVPVLRNVDALNFAGIEKVWLARGQSTKLHSLF